LCGLARETEEGTEQTFDHRFAVVTNRRVLLALQLDDMARAPATSIPTRNAREHAPLVTVFQPPATGAAESETY
jgi:hypothetical protein